MQLNLILQLTHLLKSQRCQQVGHVLRHLSTLHIFWGGGDEHRCTSYLPHILRCTLCPLLGTDGKPIYREDGKVLKGPNFSEPDITGVLVGYCKEIVYEETKS